MNESHNEYNDPDPEFADTNSGNPETKFNEVHSPQRYHRVCKKPRHFHD